MKYSHLIRLAICSSLILIGRSHAEKSNGFAPNQWLLYGLAGFTGSKVISQGDQGYYFDPMNKAEPMVDPCFGVGVEAFWKGHWSLTTGIRKERVGQSTPSSQVYFADNPFPHDFRTETWVDYLVVPLKAGFGFSGLQQHFLVQAGIYGSLVSQSNLEWKVDGNSYDPVVPPWSDNENGWILGLEYGRRFGKGTILFGVESRKGFSNMISGISGSSIASTASAWLGYGFSMR